MDCDTVACQIIAMQKNDSPGSVVKAARLARGWSQADLARRIGTNQQTIEKIEQGKVKHSRFFPRISLELNIDLAKVLPDLATPGGDNSLIKEADLRSQNRDFPVHAAAQGGAGELIVSTDPVSWVLRPTPLVGVSRAYGIIIIGESMMPEFRPGDTALINPHLPPERDETFVFYKENDGAAHASVKRLVRWTDTLWYVRQWNPPKGKKAEFTLPRAEWSKAHRVVGKYSR